LIKLQQKSPNFEFRYESLGLEHLAIALSESQRIIELDLSLNDIGSDNFSLLQRVFKSNVYMELLNLAECNINGEQTTNLCTNLRTNHNIKYLYLRNNNLGKDGSEAMSNLILDNNSMIELDLYNCRIDEQGGGLIANALKDNFCIEKFSIGENSILAKDIETI